MKKFLLILLLISLLCACAPKETAGDMTATITVDVLPAMETPELIPEEKSLLIPEDGILLKKEVNFSEGETAYDVALRTFKAEKLHYDADSTKYFLAIGNLYAGDCGELSGWLYAVNDESPTVGASQYVLQEGDTVRFYYITTF